MTILAVYGSLRSKGRANSLLSRAEYLGEDYIRGSLYGTLAFFPGVRLGHPDVDGSDLVKVELYKADCTAIKMAIDRYEGWTGSTKDSLFIPVETVTIKDVKCTIYEANFPLDERLRIHNGDWFSDKDFFNET